MTSRGRLALGGAALAAACAGVAVLLLMPSPDVVRLGGAVDGAKAGSEGGDGRGTPAWVRAPGGLARGSPAPARLRTTADRLTRTDISAVLDAEIRPGRNLVWCASFQLAWDLMRPGPGRPVRLDPPSVLGDALNDAVLGRQDVDPQVVVLAAGTAPAALEAAKAEFVEKFPHREIPDLLAGLLEQRFVGPVTYAYLGVLLPFRIAFDRFEYGLSFAGEEVASFGIRPATVRFEEPSGGWPESQIDVLDYVAGTVEDSEDPQDAEFVAELRVESAGARLFVAMIPPSRTVGETVDEVHRRIRAADPSRPREVDSFRIPVIDFDVLRRYGELEGRRVREEGNGGDDLPLMLAAQQIRFRLDETGALLSSEGATARGAPKRDIVAWKPFLVLVERDGSEHPYFVLWVDNAELLVPFEAEAVRPPHLTVSSVPRTLP